jgi:hypothetical protein
MKRHVNAIAGRLTPRSTERRSSEIRAHITEISDFVYKLDRHVA